MVPGHFMNQCHAVVPFPATWTFWGDFVFQFVFEGCKGHVFAAADLGQGYLHASVESVAQVVGRSTRDQKVPGSNLETALNLKVAVKL